MYIKSEIGELSRYGDDAIQAFVTAVDNGQARLGMQILVDVIEKFAEKFDEIDLIIEEKLNAITPAKVEAPASVKVVQTEEVKVEAVKEEAPKTESAKAKAATKEV
jgi:hypothetical protein